MRLPQLSRQLLLLLHHSLVMRRNTQRHFGFGLKLSHLEATLGVMETEQRHVIHLLLLHANLLEKTVECVDHLAVKEESKNNTNNIVLVRGIKFQLYIHSQLLQPKMKESG